jgi:hypothetical protein
LFDRQGVEMSEQAWALAVEAMRVNGRGTEAVALWERRAAAGWAPSLSVAIDVQGALAAGGGDVEAAAAFAPQLRAALNATVRPADAPPLQERTLRGVVAVLSACEQVTALNRTHASPPGLGTLPLFSCPSSAHPSIAGHMRLVTRYIAHGAVDGFTAYAVSADFEFIESVFGEFRRMFRLPCSAQPVCDKGV